MIDSARDGKKHLGEAAELLLQIARCPIIERCLNGDTAHPCSTIVLSQGVSSLDDYQAPEPWSGRLSLAPILFLSSNPSIGAASYKQFPRARWDPDTTFEYFDYRFGGSEHSSIDRGIYHISERGKARPIHVQFWRSVRARAAEILDKRPGQMVAGNDYALTEIVRCKSRHEIGVAEATSTCVEHYLESTLKVSAARLIVVLGKYARIVMADRYSLDPAVSLHESMNIAGRDRFIVFLPHPNARGVPKSFATYLNPDELIRVRSWLRVSDQTPCN